MYTSTAQSDYADELQVALHAVHNAAVLTKTVLRSPQNHVSAETKADASPVTIADFAVQALLISALRARYPADVFLGEEGADALRSNEPLAARVWELVQRAQEQAAAAQAAQSSDVQPLRDSRAGALAFPAGRDEMLDFIDLGGKGESTAKGRVWVMDPVDGTATFMEGQQYAVCLCLIVDGVQKVGVVAAPNLASDVSSLLGPKRLHEDEVDADGYGIVLSAIEGQGTHVSIVTLDGLEEPQRVNLSSLPPQPLTALNFVESTLGKTSLSQQQHKAVAELLGTKWPGTILWSQQMKYVALALGAADVMVRIAKSTDRHTCVWDHAGGNLLFTEAGGQVRDFDNKPIDFSQGRLIKGERNHGMIASRPEVFGHVSRAVQEVLGRRRSE